MNTEFEKGDQVILLDRPLGHPSKIRGVIVGVISESYFNVLITNGYSKGKIRRLKSFEIKREKNEEDKKW